MSRNLLLAAISEVQRANARALREEEREHSRQEKDALKEQKRLQIKENKEALELNISQAEQSITNLTLVTQRATDRLENYLSNSIDRDIVFDWNVLKRNDAFQEAYPLAPTCNHIPCEPRPDDALYIPVLNWKDKLVPSLMNKKIVNEKERFMKDNELWTKERSRIELEYQDRLKEYQLMVASWEERKAAFEKEIIQYNETIDAFRRDLANGKREAVIDYCARIVGLIDYPSEFQRKLEFDYDSSTKTLIINFEFPNPSELPRVKEYKFYAKRGMVSASCMPLARVETLFDGFVYQASLLTTTKLFQADKEAIINTVIFNGWIEAISKTTGKYGLYCTISFMCERQHIDKFNIRYMDAKSFIDSLPVCIGTSQYYVVPVTPIRETTNSTKYVTRLTSSNDDVSSFNLRTMDDNEFQQLAVGLCRDEGNSNLNGFLNLKSYKEKGIDQGDFAHGLHANVKLDITIDRSFKNIDKDDVQELLDKVKGDPNMIGVLFSTAGFTVDAYRLVQNEPVILIGLTDFHSLLNKHGYMASLDAAIP